MGMSNDIYRIARDKNRKWQRTLREKEFTKQAADLHSNDLATIIRTKKQAARTQCKANDMARGPQRG